jgi:hypothetical protein
MQIYFIESTYHNSIMSANHTVANLNCRWQNQNCVQSNFVELDVTSAKLQIKTNFY